MTALLEKVRTPRLATTGSEIEPMVYEPMVTSSEKPQPVNSQNDTTVLLAASEGPQVQPHSRLPSHPYWAKLVQGDAVLVPATLQVPLVHLSGLH